MIDREKQHERERAGIAKAARHVRQSLGDRITQEQAERRVKQARERNTKQDR